MRMNNIDKKNMTVARVTIFQLRFAPPLIAILVFCQIFSAKVSNLKSENLAQLRLLKLPCKHRLVLTLYSSTAGMLKLPIVSP